MKNLNKIFTWAMWILIAISVIILVWGFIAGFEANDGKAVEVLLYWAYVMIGIAAVAVIVFGAAIAAKNDPKSLVKLGLGVVAIAAVCFIVYLISPGAPAVGLNGDQPSAGTLKLTDTILNLTYIAAGLTIVAIIVGEIVMAVRNKK